MARHSIAQSNALVQYTRRVFERDQRPSSQASLRERSRRAESHAASSASATSPHAHIHAQAADEEVQLRQSLSITGCFRELRVAFLYTCPAVERLSEASAARAR